MIIFAAEEKQRTLDRGFETEAESLAPEGLTGTEMLLYSLGSFILFLLPCLWAQTFSTVCNHQGNLLGDLQALIHEQVSQ